MTTELEAKVKVDSHEPVIERLRAARARPLDAVRQVDVYYDFPDGTLLNADSGLRIRHEETPAGQTTILCYKGPRQSGPFKRREELETRVAQYDQARTILLRLGMVVRLSVTKTRQHWRLDNCLVCLDRVEKLGDFVEIEGPDEPSIRRVLQQLDLADREHLQYGYARMMAELLDPGQ